MSHVIEAFRQGLNEAVIGKRAQLIKELPRSLPGYHADYAGR
jgi:hypothetical protein